MCNPQSNYWPGKEKRAGADVALTAKDGSKFTARVCKPDGAPPFATVLIIHDYFDADNYYFDLAEQYAAAGYLGVCPNLFARQGPLSEQSHPAAGARIPAVADDDALADLDVTLDYLRNDGLLGDLAVTGFCWGGRLAYLFAARHPEVKLLLPFYGHLTNWSGPDGNKPYSPLDEAGRIKPRVLGYYGGGDDSIPLDQVRDMEKKLSDHGVQAELNIVDGAPHCFFRSPEWSEASDKAWGKVLATLQETLARP